MPNAPASSIESPGASEPTGAAAEPPAEGPISILDATGRLPAAALGYLHDHAARALAHLGVAGHVSVRVVDDAEMAAAHLEYLDQPGTTDVITFHLSGPDSPAGTLDVDMLVCLDEAARQGTRRSHPPERELLLYIVHGVLHCLGFDDHDPTTAAAMHAREDEILRAIGVGDTFGDGGEGA